MQDITYSFNSKEQLNEFQKYVIQHNYQYKILSDKKILISVLYERHIDALNNAALEIRQRYS